MRLAVENVIQVGRSTIVLRPTLRAAIRLERDQGLRALSNGITDGSLSVMRDVIRESAEPSAFNPDLLLEIGPAGLGVTIDAIIGPLLAHLLDLYGIDPDDEPAERDPTLASAEPRDPFAELFAVATGMLGWSPADAYAASPAEIRAAQAGRIQFVADILRAVFGGRDDAATGPDYSPLDREGLNALRAMTH